MGQLLLDLPQTPKRRIYEILIYQPETENIYTPWAVSISGKWCKADITIYHKSIGKHGSAHYYGIKIETAMQFVQFVESQLRLWQCFHDDITVRGIDLHALYDGYMKGVNNAQQVYIDETAD